MTQEKNFDGRVFVGFDQDTLHKFSRTGILVGLLLMITGFVGALMPQYMALFVNAWLGWLLIFAGAISTWLAFASKGRSMMALLKPIMLVITGIILLVFPMISIAAIALMMAFYLLLDSFSGFALAHDLYPLKGWGWMAFNGFTSFVLAILFIIGWPITSLVMVGLFAGISLFFDGVSLFTLAWMARKAA